MCTMRGPTWLFLRWVEVCLLCVVLHLVGCTEESAAVESSQDAGRGPCHSNADCEDSEAAKMAAELKCPFSEFYCLAGQCQFDCGDVCMIARVDVNPCVKGICISRPQAPEITYCTMLPVKCDSAEDCPAYLPSQDGTWTCEQGICRFPGFTYPTQ